MDISVYLCIFIFSLILYNVFNRRKRTLPPGLPILPLIGSLPWVTYWGKDFLQYISKKRFGNIVGARIANLDFVYINEPSIIKEMIYMDECANRHNGVLEGGKKSWGVPMGLIDPDYTDEWKEQKKFVLRSLRDQGFGRKSEENVFDEAKQLMDYITKKNNQSEDFFIKDIFNVSVVNIIWKMVASKTFSFDTEESIRFIDLMDVLFSKIPPAYTRIPMIGSVLGRKILKKRISMFKELQDLFLECIEEHESTLDEKEPRDLIDNYLITINQGKKGFHKKQLAIIAMDLFAAGSETTSTTLRWAILYMVHSPEVQTKCKEEIDKLDKSEIPNLEDIPSLPYCQATILEILRMGCIAPRTLIHRAASNVTLGGHHIKAGTYLFGNFMSTHHDPDLWERPNDFFPDRFLTSNGKAVRDTPDFFPFSLGKRTCLGESLARVELFIFFTSLIRNFTFSAPVDHPMPDSTQFCAGLTKIPDGFYCTITPRLK